MLFRGFSGLMNSFRRVSSFVILRMIFEAKCAATNSVNDRGQSAMLVP